MKNTTAVKDLVCGMDVDTATAAGRTEYKGQTYYFCGSKCKEKFDLNPEQYVGKSAGTPKSGPAAAVSPAGGLACRPVAVRGYPSSCTRERVSPAGHR